MAHPNQILFAEGVDHIFSLWPAINLAVQNEWGGYESKEKRDWMKEVITEEFGKRGKKIEVYDIEDILNQIMSDEFETVLEDDSAYTVAKDLYKLYHEILAGNQLGIQRLREAAARRSGIPTTVASNEQDSSSDEGSGDEQQDGAENDQMC